MFLFFFWKNLMIKCRIPPFLNKYPCSPTLPLLEKILHPQHYCQIRESQSTPLYKEGERVRTMLSKRNNFADLFDYLLTDGNFDLRLRMAKSF